MGKNRWENIKENLVDRWNSFFFRPDEEGSLELGREKIIVFIVALILSFSLWLMINLSRDFNLNVNLPISLGNMPPDKSLAEDLPNFATVSINGEGWKLINLYNNPPDIFVDVTQSQVNLFDQVQQQMNAMPDVNVQKVQPLFLNLDLEDRIRKKVPVTPRVEVSFNDRYGRVNEPEISPDSIEVRGAASLLENIEQWQTDSVHIDNVSSDVSESISLVASDPLIDLSHKSVTYRVDVEQFTEGEAKVFVQTHNLPRGRNISFSPSAITVKFDVPIDEYNDVKELQNLFTAYIDYSHLQMDSSGFVEPQIEQTGGSEYHITIRSFQPSKVAYFMVIEN